MHINHVKFYTWKKKYNVAIKLCINSHQTCECAVKHIPHFKMTVSHANALKIIIKRNLHFTWIADMVLCQIVECMKCPYWLYMLVKYVFMRNIALPPYWNRFPPKYLFLLSISSHKMSPEYYWLITDWTKYQPLNKFSVILCVKA